MRNLSILVITAFAFIYYGCSDSTSPQADNVEASIRSTSDTTVVDGTPLTLDTVKVLVKDIKLNGSNNDSSNVRTGMFVLNLNMNSTVSTVSTGIVPEGTYDKVKFEIHKPGGNETPPDPEFVEGGNRYSVIAKGTWNGNRFVYRSDKSAHQIITFSNGGLVISNSTRSNLTVSVNPYSWFIENGLWLDPTLSSNVNDIDNNIKDSFNRAFKDNDRNGIPD